MNQKLASELCLFVIWTRLSLVLGKRFQGFSSALKISNIQKRVLFDITKASTTKV